MNAPVPYQADVISFTDLQKMAAAIAKSGLFGMKDETQALALMLTAQAEGQHPATITQDYDIIQGKATRKTNSVLARFQQAGGKVEWHELTELKARATFSHPSGGALPMEWNIDMARRAGLIEKDNWKKYPRAMLRARCVAEGVRTVYPAAIGGYLVPEEVVDLDPNAVEGTVTARVVEQPKSISTTEPEAPAVQPENPGTNADNGGAARGKVELLSEGAKTTLKNTLTRKGRTEADLVAAGFQKIDELPFGRFQEAMEWLKKNTASVVA